MMMMMMLKSVFPKYARGRGRNFSSSGRSESEEGMPGLSTKTLTVHCRCSFGKIFTVVAALGMAAASHKGLWLTIAGAMGIAAGILSGSQTAKMWRQTEESSEKLKKLEEYIVKQDEKLKKLEEEKGI